MSLLCILRQLAPGVLESPHESFAELFYGLRNALWWKVLGHHKNQILRGVDKDLLPPNSLCGIGALSGC